MPDDPHASASSGETAGGDRAPSSRLPDLPPTPPEPPLFGEPRVVPQICRRGDLIGPYRLLDILGEGGFGEVWLAEQLAPIARRVALKVIKPGMDTRAVIARFEAERQALALMNHPNIAKVFDAGTTPAGTPYFVMEHVKGEAISHYCDRHRLSIRQRLELFAQVCDAVQHAHMKGIIHRDIKPSNILVTVAEGGAPRPVVIDFGVAKALAARLTERTLFTERGQMIGTPAYMSPEQAEMAETDIDTRSDVYSLGVVLYELLTGATPFDAAELRRIGYAAVLKVIRDMAPPRPSTRLSSMGEGGTRAATARGSKVPELAAQLRSELEWIPLKAMRKNRAERYRSASELADDIGNYLSARPLIAGPESAGYRLRKLVRRNRGAVAAAGAIAASLALAAGVSVWFGVRESAARQRESAARKRAEDIIAFVTKALRSSDPKAGGKQDTTIADAMQNAVKEIESGAFKDDTETDAGLRDTIATILQNNGRAAEAEPLSVQALEMRRRLFKGDHADVAMSLDHLASIRSDLGRVAEAEVLFVEALEMERRLFKGDHPAVASTLNDLASAREELGRAAEAEPLFVESLEMERRLSRGDDRELAISLATVAQVRQTLGRAVEAEPLYVEALEMSRRLFKGDHTDVAYCLNALGSVRLALDRAAEAEPLNVEALEMRQRLYKGDHPEVAQSLNNLAFVQKALGRTTEAEPLFVESLEMNRRLFKGDHPDVALSLNNLATVRRDMGRAAEAEPLFVEALEMNRRLLKGDHPDVATILSNLARTRQALGKTAEARQGFDEAIAMLRRLSPKGSSNLARVLWRSGSARLDSGDAAAALPELEEAVAMAEKFLPAEHPQLKEYRERLAGCKAALEK